MIFDEYFLKFLVLSLRLKCFSGIELEKPEGAISVSLAPAKRG